MKAFWMPVLISVAACGAGAQPPPAPDVRSSSASLVATLSLDRDRYASSADIEVDVVLVNRSAAPIDVPSQTLESAQLLLRVRDAHGADVASGPPPTPRADTTTIAPGERVTRRARLDVFSPALPPGEYSATVRSALIQSNTVSFRIAR